MHSMVAISPENIEKLIKQINEACHMNAALIYFVHGFNEFTYLLASNKVQYRREMKRIRNELKIGTTIADVKMGFDIVIEGITLYPLEVLIVERPCVEYSFLIHITGTPRLGETIRSNNSSYTPYFFTNKKTRDRVLSWMQNS